jgi:hypothetical protein
VVLAIGPITDTATEYGPGKASGFRGAAGLDFFVYKGLKLGAQGFFEQFSITFTPGAMMPAKPANSGTDRYFGGVIVVGYVL